MTRRFTSRELTHHVQQKRNRALGYLAAEGRTFKPHRHERAPSQDEIRNQIDLLQIEVGSIIIEHGDVIPRRVIGFDENFYLVLLGYPQPVSPLKVRVKEP